MEYESWRRCDRTTPQVSSDRSTRVASTSSSSGPSTTVELEAVVLAVAAPGVGALPLGVAGVAEVPNWSGDCVFGWGVDTGVVYIAACGLNELGTKGGRLQCRESEGHVSTAISVRV